MEAVEWMRQDEMPPTLPEKNGQPSHEVRRECSEGIINPRKLLNCILVHGVHRGLTKKAEPPPTGDVNRDSGTDRANGGWLRRLVRPHQRANSK